MFVHSVSYLFEHKVAVLVRAEFNSKHVTVIWYGDDRFFVLNLISVLQLQSAHLLIQL